jgi:hypothetical protein
MINIINLINQRISKLEKDKKKTSTIDNPRRRHPARKQIVGRILELKHLKSKKRGRDNE